MSILHNAHSLSNLKKIINNLPVTLNENRFWCNFITLGLLQPVPEGDYDALVAVMGYLMNVKDRAVTTDDMFQPLTETIELLKFYDMDIPEEVNVLLQVKIS